MPKIEEYARSIIKRVDVPNSVATISLSDNDHTTGNWISTDIYTGEFLLNQTDKRMWIRVGTGSTVDDIKEVFFKEDLSGVTIPSINGDLKIITPSSGGYLSVSDYGQNSGLKIISADYDLESCRINGNGKLYISASSLLFIENPILSGITSGIRKNVTITGDDLTLTPSHDIIIVTEDSKTITLPTPVGISGKEYTIKPNFINSTQVTIGCVDIDVIDGHNTITIDSTVTSHMSITVCSDGSWWQIIGNYQF